MWESVRSLLGGVIVVILVSKCLDLPLTSRVFLLLLTLRILHTCLK